MQEVRPRHLPPVSGFGDGRLCCRLRSWAAQATCTYGWFLAIKFRETAIVRVYGPMLGCFQYWGKRHCSTSGVVTPALNKVRSYPVPAPNASDLSTCGSRGRAAATNHRPWWPGGARGALVRNPAAVCVPARFPGATISGRCVGRLQVCRGRSQSRGNLRSKQQSADRGNGAVPFLQALPKSQRP